MAAALLSSTYYTRLAASGAAAQLRAYRSIVDYDVRLRCSEDQRMYTDGMIEFLNFPGVAVWENNGNLASLTEERYKFIVRDEPILPPNASAYI